MSNSLFGFGMFLILSPGFWVWKGQRNFSIIAHSKMLANLFSASIALRNSPGINLESTGSLLVWMEERPRIKPSRALGKFHVLSVVLDSLALSPLFSVWLERFSLSCLNFYSFKITNTKGGHSK
jgi:hypothetical protein